MEEYKDTISGETLWVVKSGKLELYYKDRRKKILHRVDGPARILNKEISWLQNGYLHRLDGPAKEASNGNSKFKWWCVDGVYVTGIDPVEYVGPEWLQEDLDVIKGK